jgi:hypothetical protein
MSASDSAKHLAQLKLYRHRSTEKAVLMSVENDRDKAVWLPLSHIASMTPANRRFLFTVTMSEWLATKNKLV